MLRWSVGRHGASDLDEHSVGRLEHIRQSVLRRIASGQQTVEAGVGMPGVTLGSVNQNMAMALILLTFF